MPNSLLHATLFGAPLGRHLGDLIAGVAPTDLVLVGLLGVLVIVAFLARRAARRTAAIPADAAPGTAAIAGLAGWAPFFTVVAACFVPLAATLYLAVSTSWTLAERAVLRRAFPASLS